MKIMSEASGPSSAQMRVAKQAAGSVIPPNTPSWVDIGMDLYRERRETRIVLCTVYLTVWVSIVAAAGSLQETTLVAGTLDQDE